MAEGRWQRAEVSLVPKNFYLQERSDVNQHIIKTRQ